jgi:hypothetical protein
MQHRERKGALEKAHDFIEVAARAGGWIAPDAKPFSVPPGRPERIDFEIFSGIAFIKDCEKTP